MEFWGMFKNWRGAITHLEVYLLNPDKTIDIFHSVPKVKLYHGHSSCFFNCHFFTVVVDSKGQQFHGIWDYVKFNLACYSCPCHRSKLDNVTNKFPRKKNGQFVSISVSYETWTTLIVSKTSFDFEMSLVPLNFNSNLCSIQKMWRFKQETEDNILFLLFH